MDIEYGENVDFDIYTLNDTHLDLIDKFKCGNEEIDKYLKYKALGDMEVGNSLTKIIINFILQRKK